MKPTHFKGKIKVTMSMIGTDGICREVVPDPVPRPRWAHCIFCEDKFDFATQHPNHIKCFGDRAPVCRRCGLCFIPYGKLWSRDLEERILKAKATAGVARKCFMCKKEFNLLGSFYQHKWYIDPEDTDLHLPDTCPEWSYWVSSDGIDFLYPNLYTEICPECFQGLFFYRLFPGKEKLISSVRELGRKLGKLPTKSFPTYIYSYQDRHAIEWFLKLLKRLPTPRMIDKYFGSQIKLLLKSGLLSEGTRRMRIGTWTLAKDGDMCFSLVERDIDDWLYNKNIVHTKEVRYPGSDMRCDWEVIKDGKRIFIEYFGLLNWDAYARKAEEKKKLAKANGIVLIGISPGDDWESVLSESLSNLNA